MRKIVHLLDDIALGGVTRLISSLIPTLADEFDQQELNLCTRFSLPPRIEADVILVHFTLGWTKLAFLIGLRLRAPRAALVVVEHTYTRGFENLNVPRRWRFRKLLRISYALADRIVCVSAGQRRWMLQAGLAAANKTFMIPCVLDLTPFAAIAEPSRQQGPMKLGAFGRFSRQKAYDTLIEAMRRVPPATAELALAGYGEDETALRAAAFGLPHVHIHERVDPVLFLSTLDAVTIPSRWEAGAVSCWEARAAARPLIVTDVDGLPEQVPAAIGMTVPADDPDALAEAICAMSSMDRRQMSNSARESTNGASERVISQWRSLLRLNRQKSGERYS